MKITKINPTKEKVKKRVVAYCRVSTLSDGQSESFESQVAYYKEMLSGNPEREFVGIYADYGLSATQAKTRPEFLRMIDDAYAGKIDVIYCKSISRFCRNTSECLKYTRELKVKGVEVIFEKEDLSTFNPMSEMVFNFMALVAQEESRSLSENIVWGLDKLAEKGIRHMGPHRVYGYTEINGVLTPNEDANAVRFIFDEYASGVKTKEIIKHLKRLNIKTFHGHETFKPNGIAKILNNVMYKGDRLIQKVPHPDYLTHKPDPSRPYKQYYVENAHEALVSREMWDKAQEIKELKKKGLWNKENKKKKESKVIIKSNSHPLRGKLVCGECGCLYERMTVKSGGVNKKFWHCKGKKQHNGCTNHGMMESVVLKKLGNLSLNQIEKIIVNKDKTIEVIEKAPSKEEMEFLERAIFYNLYKPGGEDDESNSH